MLHAALQVRWVLAPVPAGGPIRTTQLLIAAPAGLVTAHDFPLFSIASRPGSWIASALTIPS
jgi:hypothetical protein